MASTKNIFLGKKGRAFGPFTENDLTQMRANGEIDKYTYRWDEASRAWVNLEPAPPPPSSKKEGYVESRWEAVCVCRTTNLMVSGAIENVGPEGCDLVVSQISDSPQLSIAGALRLNILDAKKNVAVNVRANVTAITRQAGNWVYHLHWPSVPDL
jgi:hypothetical protein